MHALPSLRQLSFLVALSEEAHFGRAAGRLNVTQSTLSAGIRELENLLQVRLAERDRRSVIITPEGRDIAKRARRLLIGAQEIVNVAEASREGLSGELRLGAIPTVAPYLLPPILPELRRLYPRLQLYLREELTDSLIDGLWRGRLDLALIALPYEAGRLVTAPLAVDGYRLACPPDHPLAGRNSITGRDLAGYPMLLLERGHCLQRHALSAFEEVDLDQDLSFEATSLGTLLSMVTEGLGITLVPEMAIAARATAGFALSLVPLVGACPRTIVLCWRPGTSREKHYRELAGTITRLAGHENVIGGPVSPDRDPIPESP